ncbi:MAG: ABC transporter ATP-binding protein/permease [archaeon]|nr:ABC transporter ATP-binding protein/permease [archaeon]
MILKYFTKREWFLTCVCVCLIMVQVYLDLAIPDYMNLITDAILISKSDEVMYYGGRMILFAFISLGASLSAGFIAANVAASLCRTLRRKQFERVQSFSMQDIDGFSAASLITRSTNDTYQIMVFVGRGLQMIIKSPLIAVWGIYKLSGRAWEWTASTAVAVIVLVALMMGILSLTMPRFKKIQWLTDGINRATRENIDGVRVIRAYNAESYQEKKFEKGNDDLLENNLGAIKLMAPLFPVVSSINNFLTLAIYWIGASLIAATSSTEEQLYTFSDMIVFSSYAMQVISAFMLLMGVFRMLPRAKVASKRIQEVIEHEPSQMDGTHDGNTGTIGEIEFRNVSFTYPGTAKKVLDDVSFKVSQGETLAVIGPTGCGKTSLVNLIMRFYDASEGQVLVDGIDVKEYTIKGLHTKMGYVPQNAIIFSGSVEMNVNYGKGSETRTVDDVRYALRIAQAESFVDDMPDGLNAHVSQHGRNVSGGQKQRISIARAVCRRPEMFLLDDTFSALDYRTDRDLRDALKKETGGSTVLIVAQRIGTIRDADRILVMDHGKIVGMGRHEDLISSCEMYRDIARSQLSEEELQ